MKGNTSIDSVERSIGIVQNDPYNTDQQKITQENIKMVRMKA